VVWLAQLKRDDELKTGSQLPHLRAGEQKNTTFSMFRLSGDSR
jgi:hypothetical protein